MVLAIFSFVGFESATAMGAEAKQPLVNIPKAVINSTLIAGAFFVLMSFIMISGFRNYSTTLDKIPAALDAMAIMAHAPGLGIIVSIGAMVSLLTCSLACLTAISRVLLSMSRDGLIHSSVGLAHSTNATPHIASILSAITMFAVPAYLAIKGMAALDIYNATGTIATYGFLLAYILIAFGSCTYLYKKRQLKFSLVINAGIGVAFMVLAVIGSIVPWPSAPDNYLPQIFGIFMAAGIVYHVIDSIRAKLAPSSN